MTPLLKEIIDEIEGWSDGHEVKVRMANDGDGYIDFMGLTITAAGRTRLDTIIKEWMGNNT